MNKGDRVVVFRVENPKEQRFVGAVGVVTSERETGGTGRTTFWVLLDNPPNVGHFHAISFDRPKSFLAWDDEIRILTPLEELAEVSE